MNEPVTSTGYARDFAGAQHLTMDADLCVIGGGEAGFATAMAGAALGRRVVLVDPQRREPCWRNWDIVLATLRRAAAERAQAPHASPNRWITVSEQLHATLERGAADRRFARLAAMNIRLIRGRARFNDPTTLVVDDLTLQAKRYVLAVGRSDDDGVTHLLQTLLGPKPDVADLILPGREPRAVALAQALQRLGCRTTLSGPLLPDLDAELVAPLRRTLVRDGVGLLEDSDKLGDSNEPAGDASRWMRLGLERAGVASTGGQLVLSPALRTTNRRIYAVGASAGARSSAETNAQVGVVLRSAVFRLPARYDPAGVPKCVLAEPGLASVGLSESMVRAAGSTTVWRWPFAETSVANAEGQGAGILKVVSDARGRVVGAGIVHPDAAELIAFWSLAVNTRQTLSSLSSVPLPAPAYAEASRRIATLATLRRLQNPWLKRAVRMLDRLP